MEAHWAWLSRGHETFRWDIVRITLPVHLGGNAYAGWGEYRDAVASLARRRVDPDDYDCNHDGVIDTLWAIASSNGCADCTYIIGGASQNAGANIFVDGQDSGSLVAGATGNFNHRDRPYARAARPLRPLRHDLVSEHHGRQLGEPAERLHRIRANSARLARTAGGRPHPLGHSSGPAASAGAPSAFRPGTRPSIS